MPLVTSWQQNKPILNKNLKIAEQSQFYGHMIMFDFVPQIWSVSKIVLSVYDGGKHINMVFYH